VSAELAATAAVTENTTVTNVILRARGLKRNRLLLGRHPIPSNVEHRNDLDAMESPSASFATILEEMLQNTNTSNDVGAAVRSGRLNG
jgi:hypothetical protein